MSKAMKDSGIPWIGEIPKDWSTDRAKNIFVQSTTKGNERLVLQSATQDRGVVDKDTLEGVVQVAADADLRTFKTVHIDDFVISLRSFQGGFEICHNEGVISPAYTVFRLRKKSYTGYYRLLFKSYGFIDKINSLTVGIREGKNIQYRDFADMEIPIPSEVEQQRIAEFLDRKCGEIDEAIALQEDFIEELKAYKQSVITEAVTRGLNPNVKFKDSGIDWIGKIPEGWEVFRLKDVVKRRNQKVDDTTLQYIGLEHLVGFSEEMVETENVYDKGGSNMCFPDDVIFGKLRPYLGKVKVIREQCCCSAEFLVLQGASVPTYVRYLMLSDWFIEIVNSSTYGAKMPRANADFILNMNICFPSNIDQQRQIADYLDTKCFEIDSLIAIKQQKIEELKDYKKSVVYEYVTGKKEINV